MWISFYTADFNVGPTLLPNHSKIKEQNLMGWITVVPEQEPEQLKRFSQLGKLCGVTLAQPCEISFIGLLAFFIWLTPSITC